MLGRVDVEGNSDRTVPQYIKDVQRTLKGAYDTIHINLELAQKERKDAYDKQCAGIDFQIGDRVWLFNPAIKLVTLRNCHHCGGDLILSLIN